MIFNKKTKCPFHFEAAVALSDLNSMNNHITSNTKSFTHDTNNHITIQIQL